MTWIIEIVARWKYTQAFSKFPGSPFTWERENEDVKQSWRKEASEWICFWRPR